MNRRQKKKAENIRRTKLHRILDQVLDINGMEAREREKTGDKPTMFFEISGHIGKVEVSGCVHGWHDYAHNDFTSMAYLDGNKYGTSLDRVIRELDDLKERLHV